MEYTPHRTKPVALQLGVTLLALAALVGIYVASMHLLVRVSEVDTVHEASHRDLIYIYLHVALLAASGAIGFVAGKWFNGLGFAFATLFLIVIVFAMTLVQMSTYELACHGHNDIVRHWQC